MKYRFVEKGTCEEGEVKIGYFCEHCGDMHEPAIVVSSGYTWYCDTCNDANGGKIPKRVFKQAVNALACEYEKIAKRFNNKASALRGETAR